MRDLRRIRKHLTLDTAISLANALVSSRLDYCNSLLNGVSKKFISKLQRVQNSLARIVSRSSRLTSASPILKKLHWLPIRSRIHFKISLIIYKSLKFNNPPSLCKSLNVRSLSFGLRSSKSISLKTRPAAKGYTCRAFSQYAPFVWNSLPAEIRDAPSVNSFRRHHYFTNT